MAIMNRIDILLALTFLLLVPLTVKAEEDRALPKDRVIQRDTNSSNTHPSRSIEKGLKTKVKVQEPGLNRDFEGDPFVELQRAVQKIADGEDKSCTSIRGVLAQIDRALFECGMAGQSEDVVDEEKVEQAALRCDRYGGEVQLWTWKLEVLKVVCGMECFSESERAYYLCDSL